MFNFAFKNKNMVKDLAKEIVQETSKELNLLHDGQKGQLKEIQQVLGQLVDKIEALEHRLTTKELKDHQTYGHLKYKISELQTDLFQK
ncbi:MAG: hypothetical protein WEB87_01625 [Bacteriovoracaceae bacterium]